MKQPKVEKRPLCPLAGFAECRAEQCMLWDDDWRVCSLHNGSLYSMVRAAATDAAVEVIGEYRGEGDRGSPIDPAKAGPLPHCGGEAFGEAGV